MKIKKSEVANYYESLKPLMAANNLPPETVKAIIKNFRALEDTLVKIGEETKIELNDKLTAYYDEAKKKHDSFREKHKEAYTRYANQFGREDVPPQLRNEWNKQLENVSKKHEEAYEMIKANEERKTGILAEEIEIEITTTADITGLSPSEVMQCEFMIVSLD
jgi:gas vesicle protein